MSRLFVLLRATSRLAARMARERSIRPLRVLVARARAREQAGTGLDPHAVPNPDGKLLETEISTLAGLLVEIDELAANLPDDARPIGTVARGLVERSLEECKKPVVDTARITHDMQQVGDLATAMRERLLLSPQARRTLPS